MSSAPNRAAIEGQWTKVIDLIEATRVYADAIAADAGKLDLIEQDLEGDFTPEGLSTACANYRSTLSDLVSPSRVREFLEPLMLEYGKILTDDGGYTDTAGLMRALYEDFVANSKLVQTRGITYNAASAGGSNVGNGTLSRLTKDENDFNLEACTVEKKYFRCRQDQNTGTKENAESFEVLGSPASFDFLNLPTYGSGNAHRTFITNHHAGTASGGSLLRNSSFSTFDAAATPDFSGWDLVSGTQPTQDTGNYYITHPGATTDASMKFTTAARVKQTLANMRISTIDINRPYFLRIMVNKTIGSGDSGTIQLHCGSEEHSVAVSSIGANWQEIVMPFDKGCWPREFNQDGFNIDIEWHDGGGSVSGYILVDDVIFAPWDEIDGTYWFLRHTNTTPVPWLVDDKLTVTDSGGTPAEANIQYYLWLTGLGYLPSGASETFAEPS